MASAEELAPVIKPHTTIVIAQNGVGNEDAFRDKYPTNTIISCAVSIYEFAARCDFGPDSQVQIWIGADQHKPGEFTTRNREHTDLGLFPNSQLDVALEQSRVETYFSLLKEGGLSVALQDNIQIMKWEKVVCNILWNPLAAITRQNMGPAFFESSGEAEAFGKALILDVVAVGRKAGVPLDDSLADKYIAFTKRLGSFQPSMLHDLKAGIPLEIDVIVGTAMRKARELGVDAPTLRAVYALVTIVNNSLKATA